MQDKEFFQQLGTGVASLTFGVALSVFIYAASVGAGNTAQMWLLYASSFLLMLRFWWRYTELFVRFLPSKTFWHFLFDFAVSFFGILAVLFVGNMQAWALLGIAAMCASIIRCRLSFADALREEKEKLKRTFYGAVVMAVVFALVYFSAPLVDGMLLASAIFLLILAFVVYASVKK